MIDGEKTSLLSVDILLLSRVSLHGCVVDLMATPFSLTVTTTSNVPASFK